jgi:hypothetical protein
MSSQAHLTELSRELSDIIYEELLGSEGYLYSPDTGKLTHANGSPIDLGLSLTCKQLHAESHEQTFRNRPITFRPISSNDSKDVPIERFAELLRLQRKREAWLLEECRKLSTDGVHEEILDCYPEFDSLLRYLVQTSSRHGILD